MSAHTTLSLDGNRYGRLVVVSEVSRQRKYIRQWECVCDCGTKIIVRLGNLRSGNTESCGCLQQERASVSGSERATHRMSNTKTYRVWSSMKERCLTPTHHAYADYGGRGIRVCERWMRFENFLADMGEKPPGLTLDRTNNELGYDIDNCRWATWTEQATNKRTTVYATINGETKKMADWAKELGVSYSTISHRYQRFGSFELPQRSAHFKKNDRHPFVKIDESKKE